MPHVAENSSSRFWDCETAMLSIHEKPVEGRVNFPPKAVAE